MKKIKISFFILFSVVFLYSIFTGGFLKPIHDLHRGQKIVLFFKNKYNAEILYNLKFYIIEMKVIGEIDDGDLISLGFRKVNSFYYCSDYGRILIEKYYDYKIVKYKNKPCKAEIE